jgi:hypothetical protein
MNLDRCLQACTWSRLWAIGHARGLAVPRQPTKAGLLALVRADLARDRALSRELCDLPPEALVALQLLAAAGGWLPARDFRRRFGPLRPFKPWRKETPPDDAPWRAPASTTELLWYRGLLYAGRRAYGHLSLDIDGFWLAEELAALLPPPPSPARAVPAPAGAPPAPHLLYNLALLHAHLSRGGFQPRQGRWLTPTQFRPLLDLLWPPGCPLLAADRDCRGERSTRLLRALHFLAEAAGFLPAPPPPAPEFRTPPAPAVDEILSAAPFDPDAFENRLAITADPDRVPSLGKIVVVGEKSRPQSPPQEESGPSRLLPTLQWHEWLAASPAWQLATLRSVLAGRADGQDPCWRVYRLPGWREADPLAALRRLYHSLALCPGDGTWLDLETFLHSLPDHHLDLAAGPIEPASDPHRLLLVGFLAWLGIVQLDRWQAPTAFRITPAGAALLPIQDAAGPTAHSGPEAPAAAWHITAVDDDALSLAVDLDSPPALLYRLATASPVEWTAPGAAQITPGSLARAARQESSLERSHRIAALVRLLDAGLPEPLPGEIVGLLRRWAGGDAALRTTEHRGGHLAIRRVTLLESDDPDLLAYLAGKRGIRRHFRRAYGRRAVALDSNTLESLLRKLRRLGLVPDVEVDLDPGDRPAANRRWGAEDAGHLLLAAKIYNRLPGRTPLGHAPHVIRPTHYIPQQTLDRLAKGLSPRILETVEQMADDAVQRLREAIDGWRAPYLAASDRLTGPALAETLDLIGHALHEGHALDIEYYTAGRGELTRRTVEPLRLEDRDGVAYLVAYCRLRQDERVFRVDRIRSAQITS